jgi:hypothetical protein
MVGMEPQRPKIIGPVTGAQPGAHSLRSARGADRMKPEDTPEQIGFILSDVFKAIEQRISDGRKPGND